MNDTQIKPAGRAEAALREAGYQSPNCCRSINEEDWKELEAHLAYLRGESPACRDCAGPLQSGQPKGARCKDCAMVRYLRAVEEYNRLTDLRGTFRHRVAVFFANIWSKIWGGVVLLVATSFLALGLCAVEVPDSIIRALVAVESGAKWIDTGEIVGDWKRGKAGEISHFQLSSAAIQDMGAANRTARIASCPVLAESLARLWLSRCYERAGNWPEAVARYNAGSRYRSRAARDYSARVLALSSL